jgi:hypothetical protein
MSRPTCIASKGVCPEGGANGKSIANCGLRIAERTVATDDAYDVQRSFCGDGDGQEDRGAQDGAAAVEPSAWVDLSHPDGCGAGQPEKKQGGAVMIVEVDFLDHPKTIKLRRALKMETAPMLLLRIWAHCQLRKCDYLGTKEDIAAICRWDDDADPLVAALLLTGWIDEETDEHGQGNTGHYLAHGWSEYNNSWLKKVDGGKKRASQAQRNQGVVGAGKFLPASNQLAGKLPDQLAGTSPASCQLPDQLAGAEERRGDEKRRDEMSSVSADADAPDFSGLNYESASTVNQSEQLNFAKKEVGGLFARNGARQKAWTNSEERRLGVLVAEMGPDRFFAELRMIRDWFRLATEQNAGRKEKQQVMLPASCWSLMEKWGHFVDRAYGALAEAGFDPMASKSPRQKSTGKKEGAAPDEEVFRLWQLEFYGEGVTLTWDEAMPAMRDEFWKAQKAKGGAQ